MSTSSVGSTGSTTSTSTESTVTDRYEDMDLDVFLQLLITELQSQDPSEPMKNSELVNQISQIRAIESNTRLTETLESVMLGQNMSTASGLLGRTITGLTDDGTRVEGVVDKITVTDGTPVLYVGDDAVSLSNVEGIVPTETAE